MARTRKHNRSISNCPVLNYFPFVLSTHER